MQPEPSETELLGQVTFRRPLSRRLVFFDLLLCDCETLRWVELLVKAEGALSQQDVRDIRDSVRLGDKIRAVGAYENDGGAMFLVQRLWVVERWRDRHPATPFLPQPAPQRASGHGEAPPRKAGGKAGGAGAYNAAGGLASCHARSLGVGDGDGGGSSAGSTITAHRASVGDGATNRPPAVADAGRIEGGSGAVEAAPADAGACGGSLAQPPVCKYWAATGRCPKGDGTCQYDHPSERRGATGAQQLYVRSRRSERLAAAADQGFVHEPGDTAKRRRAAMFAEWLVQTYGKDFLNSGSGVLDVAGGRGALTFHLLLRWGVAATLVEPRPAKLSRSQHRELAATGVAGGAAAEGLQLPQLRRRFERALWWDGQEKAPADIGGGGGGAGCDGGGGEDEAAAVRELLAGCSLVVGLHPDQATEAILDFALEAGKPFAIVPCCVFPRLFPHRRLRMRQGPGAGPGDGAELSRPVPAPAAETSAPLGPSPHPAAVPPGGPSSADGCSAQSGLSPLPHPQSFPRRWVPVESYPQLLEYLMQRAQLHDRERSSGGGSGSGLQDGGPGHEEAGRRWDVRREAGPAPGTSHVPPLTAPPCEAKGAIAAPAEAAGTRIAASASRDGPSWRRSQRAWLQLWQLASERQSGNPDLDLRSGPGSQPPGGVASRSSGSVSGTHWGPESDRGPGSPPTSPLLQAQPSPGAAATLDWLEEQGVLWEARVVATGSKEAVTASPLTATPAGTAAAAAADAASTAVFVDGDAGATVAAVAIAGDGRGERAAAAEHSGEDTAARLQPLSGRAEAGPGPAGRAAMGLYGAPLAVGSAHGTGKDERIAGGAGADPRTRVPRRSGTGVGPPGMARLQFLGANQVVYRLPS